MTVVVVLPQVNIRDRRRCTTLGTRVHVTATTTSSQMYVRSPLSRRHTVLGGTQSLPRRHAVPSTHTYTCPPSCHSRRTCTSVVTTTPSPPFQVPVTTVTSLIVPGMRVFDRFVTPIRRSFTHDRFVTSLRYPTTCNRPRVDEFGRLPIDPDGHFLDTVVGGPSRGQTVDSDATFVHTGTSLRPSTVVCPPTSLV